MNHERQNIKRTLIIAYALGITCWALIVSFSLNWSSLGMWNNYVAAGASVDEHRLLGQPRGIRSDEWLANTPIMLAYAEHLASGMQGTADYAGPSGAELLMNQPTPHFATLFRPQFWGFFLFDKDRGLSFLWGAKVIGLCLAFFTTLFLLTESPLISAAGTAWFVFSSFLQWWYSICLPELVATCLFATLGAWLVVSQTSRRLISLGWITLVVGSIDFILCVYPPFMVPTAHACMALWCALCIRHGMVRGRSLLWRVGLLGLAGVAIGTVMLVLWHDIGPVVNLVQNTVYPGRRVAESGTFPAFRYLSQLADSFFSDGRYPASLGNVCEGAGFILLWPLVIPFILAHLSRSQVERREMYAFIPLLVVLIAHLVWMSFSMPPGVAAALGLHLSPSVRTLLGPGILNVVVLSMATSLCIRHPRKIRWPALAVCTVALVSIAIGWGINASLPSFLSFAELSIASVALGTASVGLLMGQPVLFWVPILFLVIPNILTNPIIQGADPLTQSPLVKVAKRIRAKHPNDRWVMYGDGLYANLLKVAGVRLFNGVSYAPRMDDYRRIDPTGSHASIYNRYAHISVNSPSPSESPSFQLLQGDSILIKIHPCDSAIARLGIRYIVFPYPPQPHEIACLQPVGRAPIGQQFYIYKVADIAQQQKRASQPLAEDLKKP